MAQGLSDPLAKTLFARAREKFVRCIVAIGILAFSLGWIAFSVPASQRTAGSLIAYMEGARETLPRPRNMLIAGCALSAVLSFRRFCRLPPALCSQSDSVGEARISRRMHHHFWHKETFVKLEECDERLRLTEEYSRAATQFSRLQEALKTARGAQIDQTTQAVEAAWLEMEDVWIELSVHTSEHGCFRLSPPENAAVATPDAILAVNGERRFVPVNEAAAEIVGLRRARQLFGQGRARSGESGSADSRRESSGE
jgi:PAS domain-containing protein